MMKFSLIALFAAITCVATHPITNSNSAPASLHNLQTRQVDPETLRNLPMNPSQGDFERETLFDPAIARDSYARRHLDAAEARERLEQLRSGWSVYGGP